MPKNSAYSATRHFGTFHCKLASRCLLEEILQYSEHQMTVERPQWQRCPGHNGRVSDNLGPLLLDTACLIVWPADSQVLTVVVLSMASVQAYLYGEIASREMNKKYKAVPCKKRNCSGKGCDFLHPGEEAQGAKGPVPCTVHTVCQTLFSAWLHSYEIADP